MHRYGSQMFLLVFFLSGAKSTSLLKKIVGPDYDATLRSGFDEGTPVEVFVDIHVESFGNIREENMEFKVYSYFKQTWSDKRLVGRTNRTLTFKAGDIKDVWTPDAYCYNARTTNLMLPNSETHSKISLSPEGVLVYSRGVTFTASCLMDLHHFPHDSQSCHLKFGSYAYNDSAIMLKWLNQVPQVSNGNMAQFTFLGGTFSSELESFSGVNYTTIIVTFSFQRRLGFYLLQVYVPDISIVVLSWIAFWLVPYDPGVRLTIGVTTILTIMLLSGTVNLSMPPVSYAKAMDWYLMVSFAFVFLSVIESLAVFLLSSKPLGKTFNTKEVNCHSFKSKILSTLKARHRRKGAMHRAMDKGQITTLEMNIMLMDQTLPMSLEDLRIKDERECYEAVMRRNKKIAHRIDQISRILFPVTFASYTLGYWLSYS